MNAKETLTKQSSKSIAALFKQYLMLIEDLKFEHDQYHKKLLEHVPSQYHPAINCAEYFDEKKMQWLRKRVLDIGNEALRTTETNLQEYSVNFVFKN
jgi:hypothetical protein